MHLRNDEERLNAYASLYSFPMHGKATAKPENGGIAV
jgi:hypothetical protein